jgi:hypothetical protein
MNYRIFLIIAGILCALLFSAGCTQTPVTPPATTVATTVPTTLPTSATPVPTTAVATPTTPSPEPQPVDTLPSYQAVTVDVVRNVVAINPAITATFRGGFGSTATAVMDVTVFKSDGTVEQKQLRNPKVNDQIVIQGTTGTDRVVVKVTMNDGKTYTIFDQKMDFRSY